MLIRILYIWHERHPASGYVQGINDLAIPFIAVFLNDYIKIDFDKFNVPTNMDELVKLRL